MKTLEQIIDALSVERRMKVKDRAKQLLMEQEGRLGTTPQQSTGGLVGLRASEQTN